MDEKDTRRSAGGGGGTAAAGRAISLVVFGGLLLIVFAAPLPYGSVEPWWEALFECLVFLLAALSLLGWLVKGGHLLAREFLPLVAPPFALAAYACAQTVPLFAASAAGAGAQPISFDPFATHLAAIRFLALAIFLALLLRHTTNARRLRALACAVISVALLSALFGLARQVSQRGAEGFILPYLRPATGYAQFVNKNHYAFLAEMAFGLLAGLAAGLFAGRRAARGRVLIYVALAVPVWATLVLSNSRGGVLAMLCQVVFIALAYGAGRTKRRREDETAVTPRSRATTFALRVALACALVAVIIFGVIWVGGDPLAERMASVREETQVSSTDDPSRTGRAAIWEATWRLALAHPIAGTGFGGYWIAVTNFHDGSGALVPQQAHNDYLELWASGGVISVALAVWFVVAALRPARARLADPDPFRRAVALGALTGLFGVAVHSLVDFGLHLLGNAFVCAALLALAAARVGSHGSHEISQKTT
ncbi:MAG: O-antigen ligase family protein [Pyrinomonadaceae bacterium]